MLELFTPTTSIDRQHPIFRQLCEPQYAPERAVLQGWSTDFIDRDRKLVQEFQTTFESSFWELYLFSCLKALGSTVDFRAPRPDFVATVQGHNVCIEATVTQPAVGQTPAYGPGPPDVPESFDAFNREAALRIATRFAAKSIKYIDSYAALEHVAGRPYVIALAPFDRPLAHFAVNRPILAALYGMYFDEDTTIATSSDHVVRYPVDGVSKTPTADVGMGFFADDRHSHVSAVVYSPVATWGKIRALADAPDAQSIYTTYHPNPDSLIPTVRHATKADYSEDLLDGLYVFHNPCASIPLPSAVFTHGRVAHFVPDSQGIMKMQAPDDFLLLRTVQSFQSR